MADGSGGLYSPTIPLVHQGTAGIATNSTGDKWIFTIPFKCEVVRAFCVVQGSSSNGTAAVIKFDKRPTAGSDSGRGDGDVAVLSKTASVSQQGKMLYEDPATRVTLDEGDEVVVEVTTADGAANAMTPGLLIREIPEIAANNSAMVAA
jgi:hypothetical protein